jgi:hypothetical protein
LYAGDRPGRWQAFLIAIALALTFGSGGATAAQDATPNAECVPPEDGEGCLPTAPTSDRVDLDEPTFSNPTEITNPFFPISEQARLIQLGVDEGESLRAEAALMPGIKSIAWNGQEIETVVSQFVAYGDGRILEVAYDYFAQDDEGNVWYFGEDVFNYEDGEVVDTEGTWLAGKDGPPGMIMPADPQVGNVFRPENIPGFAFEEVAVVATDVTVNGPRGPIEGAIETSELQADGNLETKHFAPGYGEFSALGGTEYVTAALCLPVDAIAGTIPAELSTLETIAIGIFDEASTEDWDLIAANTTLLRTIWEVHQAGSVPPVLALQMDNAIEELESAVENESVTEVRQAALDVARATLDLQLPYKDVAQGNLEEMRLWTDQLDLDVTEDELGDATGDVAAIEAVWDRVDESIGASVVDEIDSTLADLRSVIDNGDLAMAADLASELADLLVDANVGETGQALPVIGR